MYAEERRAWLLARARAQGRVDVVAVSDELAVAPETVRRDLKTLEAHGLLRRVHGGALPVERLGFESALSARVVSMRDEKDRIAKRAVDLLDGAESLYLDEGSTTQAVVEHLPADRPLTVVTSALPAALALAARANVTVLVLGGRVRGRTLATVDHWASRMLDDLVLDLTLVGTNGISLEHGLTTPDPAVAAIKAAAVSAARRRVLLCDHTKFGLDSFCRFAHVRDLEAVVSDAGLDEATAARYENLGVTVVRA